MKGTYNPHPRNILTKCKKTIHIIYFDIIQVAKIFIKLKEFGRKNNFFIFSFNSLHPIIKDQCLRVLDV
jgi:hypothetical protein